jgi:hypothetical protein
MTSGGPGVVLSTVELSNGDVVDVTFTTIDANGIIVANPDPEIFTKGPATTAEIRAIVSAVIALDRAAVHGTRLDYPAG